MLTVTTLGFALVTSSWLAPQSWALGEGGKPGRPALFNHELDTSKEYYYFVLAILCLMLLLAGNVRRGGIGRLLIAVRDNEDGARSFTIRARRVKIQGFMLSGFIAGIGGAAYAHLLSYLGADAFPVATSINVVAMTVIGGISLLAGPILGALYIVGIPAFVPLDSAGLATTQLGWLVLILYLPGGLAQAIEPMRNRYVRVVARRAGIEIGDVPDVVDNMAAGRKLPAVVARAEQVRPRGSALLEARGLEKRFGGVTAVNGVNFSVGAGEILGLIGPNGAGKSTTFEILAGFTAPDGGRVFFDGGDVSHLSPEERARKGLIRSFQDAALFPTMTVLDVARLSFERTTPTRFFESVAGFRRPDRRKDRLARDLIGSMGLDSYRDKSIQELSTGTRRITELACLMALMGVLDS